MPVKTRFAITLLALAGAIFAPASVVHAQPTEAPGIGIRLLEGPAERSGDPRAQAYVVDHVAPGANFTRRFEVLNNTESPVELAIYPAAAEIRDGSFTVEPGRATNELTGWITVTPQVVRLDPGTAAPATMTFAVPSSAPSGEFYAAVLADRTTGSAGEVAVSSRVGIRVYLSIGSGGEPASDFRVDSLQASRTEDGTPVVEAQIVNTGGRALDLSGELTLSDGPGGLAAGPFLAELGTTLAIGGRAPVRVELDPEIPDGPWLARITARAGDLERTAEAVITFPAPGTEAEPVPASPVRGSWPFWVALGLLALLLALLLFLLWRRRRRRDEEEDEDAQIVGTAGVSPGPSGPRPPGAPASPDPTAPAPGRRPPRGRRRGRER